MFERHGCTFVAGSNRTEEAHDESGRTLEELVTRLEETWEKLHDITVPGFRPIEAPVGNDTVEYDSMLKTMKQLVLDAFRMPPELLTKEKGYELYTKVVDAVKGNPLISGFVTGSAGDEAEPTFEDVSGAVGRSQIVAARAELLDDDHCGGYCAPC